MNRPLHLMLRPLHLSFLALGLLLACRPVTLEAQSTLWPRLSFDWGLGVLVSIPSEFESEPCGSLYGLEARAGAAWALSETVAVESSFGVAVPRPTPCAADRAVPVDGTVTRSVLRDGVDRRLFVSTAHRLVFDPAPITRLRPRVLLGGGRLWNHRAWFLSTGIGFRLGSERWPRIIEIERIELSLPIVQEIDTFVGGVLVDRSMSPELKRRDSMWSLRVRLPWGS